MKVEFIPHISDYVFIAEALNEGTRNDLRLRWIYTVFLLINAIVFPAYLMLNERYLIAAAVFLLNLAAYFFLSGSNWKKRVAETYAERLGHILDKPMTVELTDAGAVCTHNGNVSVAIWGNITNIVETNESVYLFFRHNASFVRKEAFETPDELSSFLNFARERITPNT
jgi:hypothetical protein